MKSAEIRSRFFDFFVRNGHEKVSSSSLIPAQDPTLLFANAGMNQFKDVFLGLEKRSYSRAVTIQKCVRAGGKHNDLDNVGFTRRHCTFFEMMGNFSFGDYFKKEAITYAWEFITKELKLAPETIHISVYKTDDESYDIWQSHINIPTEKIHRLGEVENFWSMGDVGPCGPCTEMHVDRGPEFGCSEISTCGPACDCDRFLEIWNIVFMQFDRQSDGSLKELYRKGVDTGAGLERICAIVQNTDSVFQTDLFNPIIQHTETIAKKVYAAQSPELQAAFHVLADHARSTTMLINDGCAPSNDGRGYVLRKIIRRAALFAQKLSNEPTLFPALSRIVIELLSPYYPELLTNGPIIYDILLSEIKKFSHNLVRGRHIMAEYMQQHASPRLITGEQTFKMYDTYGFPVELTELIAQEHGYAVDHEGFQQKMHTQQTQSGKKAVDPLDHFELDPSIQTIFTGYQELGTTSVIKALICDDRLVDIVPAGYTCWIITDKSPYFIVGGGQVPDTGWITTNTYTNQCAMDVLQLRYINGRIAAQVTLTTPLSVGDTVTSHVNPIWRTNAMKNHTATHLLQAALITKLGKTVKQAGSLVHPDYLRFDFTYHEPISPEIIKEIEDMVNQIIRENIPVHIEYTSMRDAIKKGALAFFGDKYNPENVRMVNINDFSIELCGGTHVSRTGDIGTFKITENTALSAGHRRLVAVTGPKAMELFQELFTITKQVTQEFKVKREQIIDILVKLKSHDRELSNQLKQLKRQVWRSQLAQEKERTTTIHGIPFLYIAFADLDNEELKEVISELAQKQPGLYFVTSTSQDRCLFIAQLSPQYIAHINMPHFAQWLKDTHRLHGGCSDNAIRGGGEKYSAQLQKDIEQWIKKNAKP